MKQLILLLFLFLNTGVFGQDTPMDTYEKRMFKEFDFHNIKNLFTYVNENSIADKDKFNIGDRTYKARVKRTSKKAEYDENVFISLKSGKFRYYFYKKRRTVDFYCDRLFQFSVISTIPPTLSILMDLYLYSMHQSEPY